MLETGIFRKFGLTVEGHLSMIAMNGQVTNLSRDNTMVPKRVFTPLKFNFRPIIHVHGLKNEFVVSNGVDFVILKLPYGFEDQFSLIDLIIYEACLKSSQIKRTKDEAFSRKSMKKVKFNKTTTDERFQVELDIIMQDLFGLQDHKKACKPMSSLQKWIQIVKKPAFIF